MGNKHTPGKWTVGKNGGTVVSDEIPENYVKGSGHDETDYYGGFLVGESIRECDAKLIAAAPELLEALKEIESHCDNQNSDHEVIWRIAHEAIKKATI